MALAALKKSRISSFVVTRFEKSYASPQTLKITQTLIIIRLLRASFTSFAVVGAKKINETRKLKAFRFENQS